VKKDKVSREKSGEEEKRTAKEKNKKQIAT